MLGVTCRQESRKQGQQQACVATAEGDTRLKVTTVGAQVRGARHWCCYVAAGTLPAATKVAHLLQMRRPAGIRERMLAAAAEQANALLLLSGGHPARHVPFADK